MSDETADRLSGVPLAEATILEDMRDDFAQELLGSESWQELAINAASAMLATTIQAGEDLIEHKEVEAALGLLPILALAKGFFDAVSIINGKDEE